MLKPSDLVNEFEFSMTCKLPAKRVIPNVILNL